MGVTTASEEEYGGFQRVSGSQEVGQEMDGRSLHVQKFLLQAGMCEGLESQVAFSVTQENEDSGDSGKNTRGK